MENFQKRCPSCNSDKIIPNPIIHTLEGLDLSISVSKTRKKTGFFNSVAPSVSKIKANICGNCGYIQLFAEDANRLWAAYQMSLKNS